MPLPSGFQPDPQPRRTSKRRDRHGRGLRGSTVLPGPLTPHGTRYPAGEAQRFDELVLSLVRQLQARWGDTWGHVEFGVEETPVLPTDWDPVDVPLATLVRATSSGTARIVLFRRPIEQRTSGRVEMSGMVLAVLIEQVAELLGREPEEIDPRYEA